MNEISSMHVSQGAWIFFGAIWLVAGYFLWKSHYRAWVVLCLFGAATAGLGIVVTGLASANP